MTEPYPRRPPGRPRIDPHDESVEMHLSLPSKLYDRVYQVSRARGTTVPEVIRVALRQTLGDRSRPE